MWKIPEFEIVFKELWNRKVNPLLKVGSFESLPDGVGPSPSSAYWSTEKQVLMDGFKDMDRALIQSWITEIVGEYPVNPFGDTWAPKPRLDL